ncbi:MAG TPA: sodium:proton antiporter [Candidatus Limnocylindrales bacterium]|nr:sodium:proton antiporter [Candidatus Limnocylindrales bacterium]
MGPDATIQAISLFVALVAAAGLIGLAVHRLAIPYSVALVVLGLVAGALLPITVEVPPELVLLVLLPGLVFEGALRIHATDFRRMFGGVALLAAPGVLVSAAVVGIVLSVATSLPLELGFVVGAMVAATDPVAVVSTFKQLGSPRRLATLIESESLFNDGTAIVVFLVAVQAALGEVTLDRAVVSIVVTVAVSTLIGLVVGLVASRLMTAVDDHLIALTLSVAVAYGTYLVADRLGHSGVIATVVAGLVIGDHVRRSGVSTATLDALDAVWEFAAFLMTALVFLLIGLAISFSNVVSVAPAIAWGIVAILVGRAIVVYLLLGGTSRIVVGRQLPAAWLHVLFWAGLRGAVAIAMALSLPASIPQRALLQEITFGIVLFTLLVQGSTIEWLIERLGAGRASLADEEPSAAVQPR